MAGEYCLGLILIKSQEVTEATFGIERLEEIFPAQIMTHVNGRPSFNNINMSQITKHAILKEANHI